MISVAVGDPHVVPSEIPECERVLGLVAEVAADSGAEAVTVFGDLHNNHDTVSVRVSDFWCSALQRIKCRKIVIVGNHDCAFTDRIQPHALRAYASMEGVTVVDAFTPGVLPGVDAVPWCPTVPEFLAAVAPRNPALFCHQTFNGAMFDNGIYAPDGVDPGAAEIAHYTQIWSGHLHTRHRLGRITYIGAPRWRTRSDANQDRYIYVLRHTAAGVEVVKAVPTGPVCRRIWTGDDRPGAPYAVPAGANPGDDHRVDVYGSDPAVVRTREAELRASCGARTRPFPTRPDRPEGAVGLAAGVDASFDRYAAAWQPKFGSSPAAVVEEVRRRAAA